MAMNRAALQLPQHSLVEAVCSKRMISVMFSVHVVCMNEKIQCCYFSGCHNHDCMLHV